MNSFNPLRTVLNLEQLGERINPTAYAVELTGPAMGTHGNSLGQVVSGGLTPNPAYEPQESGVVVVNAPTPQEAIRQAFVGSVLVNLSAAGKPNTSYAFSPGTVGLAPAEHKAFVLVQQSPPTPPDPAATNWQIALEDMAAFPDSDWDYNDHTWAVSVIDLQYGTTGTSSISGTVWQDMNGNNVRDTSPDQLLANVAVNLFRNGVYLRAIYTNSGGGYSFTNLGPGSYQVQVEGDFFRRPVAKDVGNDLYDSDVDAGGWSVVRVLNGTTGSAFVEDAGLSTLAAPTIPDGTAIINQFEDAGHSAELRVAKWQTAFEADAAGTKPVLRAPDVNGYDFIDHDIHRFNVLVFDTTKAGQNSVPVTLATNHPTAAAEYKDNATTLTLLRVNLPGWNDWFMSDSQLLVSNKTDDEFPQAAADNLNWPGNPNPVPKAGGIRVDNLPAEPEPNNNKNTKKVGPNTLDFPVEDRTHIVALGGKVEVKYLQQPLKVSDVKVKKIVKVNINIMLDKPLAQGGTPTTPDAMVAADLKRANELYAQVGIVFQLAVAGINTPYPISNPPAGTGLDTGVPVAPGAPPSKPSLDARGVAADPPPTPKLWLEPSAEERALLGFADLRTPTVAGKDDVEVYYINRLSNNAGGLSYTKKYLRAAAADQKLGDSVTMAKVMTVFNGTEGDHLPEILAHEVGHILEDPANASLSDKTHFPNTGLLPSPTERTNLMTTGAAWIVGGSGFKMKMSADPVPVPEFDLDPAFRRQLAPIGPSILDSRRLTAAQETAMTTNRPELINPGE